jgi:hypothetical protein
MAAWCAIVSEGKGPLPLDRIGDVGRLAALGSWRVTQGIYRFDQGLYVGEGDVIENIHRGVLGQVRRRFCLKFEIVWISGQRDGTAPLSDRGAPPPPNVETPRFRSDGEGCL